MRTIILPSGGQVRVGVIHTTTHLPKHGKCRCTIAILDVGPSIPNAVKAELQARSVCKPPDVFDRKIGRRIAATRLLKVMREQGMADADDRWAVFDAICPGYKAPAPSLRRARKAAKRLERIRRRLAKGEGQSRRADDLRVALRAAERLEAEADYHHGSPI